MPSSTLWILAVGNEFRRDDGLAIEAARRLAETLPRDPALRLLHLAGLPLPAPWHPANAVLILDAVATPRHPPGTLISLGPEELQRLPADLRVSSHGIGFGEWIRLVSLEPGLPRALRFLGVVGQDFGPGKGLSTAVAAALPRLVAQALHWIRKLRSEP